MAGTTWNTPTSSAGGGTVWQTPLQTAQPTTTPQPTATPQPQKPVATTTKPRAGGTTWNSPPTMGVDLASGTTPGVTPQPDGFFKQLAKGTVQGTVDLAEGLGNTVFQTVRGAISTMQGRAGEGAPAGSIQRTIPEGVSSLWSLARSLPPTTLYPSREYTVEDAQNLINESKAGKAAFTQLVTTFKTQPGTLIGKAIPNVIASLFPYGAIAKAFAGSAKVAEAAKAAQALAAESSAEHVYAASDEFAQGMARATGRGAVHPSAPAKVWQIKPGFTHVEPSARNASRVNWPPRIRSAANVASTTVRPAAAVLRPSPLNNVKPSYGFMNPTTTLVTETGESTSLKGPVADLLRGSGVVLNDPITLEDGMVIEKPVLSGYGVFDAAKGVQTTETVAQQVRDMLLEKPVNNLRAFHPDPETQDLLQRAVNIVNNIDSPAYMVDPDEFAYSGLSKQASVEAAAHEAAKRFGAENIQANLMQAELQSTFAKQFAKMGTTGEKTGDFIVNRGADAAEVTPESVAARHGRGAFDVWYGLMRSLGMNPDFKGNYLPIVVREGHTAIARALEKARMIDGPHYVPDILKEGGFTPEQIAETQDMRGDPNDIITRMIKKHKDLNTDDASKLASQLHAQLEERVASTYFPDANAFQRTAGIQRGGQHGITLTIDHVLHQGTNWEALEKLAAKTGEKLTIVKDVPELIARQFANIARNVRLGRLAKVMVNGKMYSKSHMDGLVDLGVGYDTIWVHPRVKEFINRVLPPNDPERMVFLRQLSRVSKEGTVNWNLAIHAKTLTTGQLSLYGIRDLSTAFDDMATAAKQIEANGPLMYEAAQSGLNLNYMTSQYRSIFSEMAKHIEDNGGGPLGAPFKAIGAIHDKMHEVLFDRYAKMLGVSGYLGVKRQLLARGVSDSVARRSAADAVNDVLGTPVAADIPTKLNKYGYIWLFAAQFKLGAFRTMGKAFGKFLPATATPAERKVLVSTARSINARAAGWQFMLSNVTQYALTKTFSVDNDPGHEFDVWTGTYGTTPSGKKEKVYIRLKDFNTDPEIFADKLGEAIVASTTKAKSPDISTIFNEGVSLSGPTLRTGVDAVAAAQQHKLDLNFVGTEALDFATPSWLQALLKQSGVNYPMKPFETKVPVEDLWWTALGFSPFGAAPPKQPGLSLGLKGLKVP